MKATFISIIIAGVLIGASIFMTRNDASSSASRASVDNVSVVDGKQIISISAKGGYSPRVTQAKAGIPTVLKVETHGTFDCSGALSIPSLDYRKNLPPTGETLIDVPPQKAGTTMRGLCAMGMYNFTVVFN